MALTLANGSITELTTSTTSTAMDIANAHSASISIRHLNGTGTITSGGTVKVEISYDGTNWETDTTFTFGLTASTTEFRTYTPPADGMPVNSVRLVYTLPAHSSGSGDTLNARFGKATA